MSGARCVHIGSRTNEGGGLQYYDTPDEAAKAFVEKTHTPSMYTRHEYGAEIYSKKINGTKKYSYTTPRIGKPHEVMVGYATPPGTEYVAFVHIHPNYDTFSTGDKNIAKKQNVNAYVAGPSKQLRKYTVETGSTEIVCSISPAPITTSQSTILKELSWYTWASHLNEGCHKPNNSCNSKSWPAW